MEIELLEVTHVPCVTFTEYAPVPVAAVDDTVKVIPVSPAIATVPLNHCSVCDPEGAMLEVKVTDEPVQNDIGPPADITGAGFPVTLIVLLVLVQVFPFEYVIVLTTE